MTTKQHGKLDGKVAIITGGTTGIGLATAKLFAQEGAKVVVTGSTEGSVAAARSELDNVAEVLRSDAGDPAAVSALFDHVEQRYGGVDTLFLNAGIAKFGALAELPEELFDNMLQVNLKGPWYALRRAATSLRDGGTIVVNTSIVDVKGFAGSSAYAATKAGLRALVRTAAVELAGRNVRVNAVSPGPIDTPIHGKLGMPKEVADQFKQGMTQSIPLQRFGRPEEVANVALFLASSASSFVTGSEIATDGGLSHV